MDQRGNRLGPRVVPGSEEEVEKGWTKSSNARRVDVVRAIQEPNISTVTSLTINLNKSSTVIFQIVHRDRHTAKGSQLHRKDSMLGHNHSPITENGRPTSMHGSSSPEVMRPNMIKGRTGQLQYRSPTEMTPNYSPITNSSGTYSALQQRQSTTKRSSSI
ncbi:hypothetical protein M7I_6894 [Glarea lozoyensis 74030]|uniref:Uncharacterized protein n=1 Tax=Glarea lozoyensis (strain ATCC 74030 / MF5533) TaxID=1104152 RepID=H0EVT8_GLAL7|nr:hypothetical protein M7I_6894 [Glarea lozoyensis 74030]